MVAAPQYGILTFIGKQSRQTYSLEVYVSDVDKALVNLDGGNGASATSPTDWIPPEPVDLIDFVIKTGLTDTDKARFVAGSNPTGDTIRWGQFLDSLNRRSPLKITFKPGTKFSMIQIND